MGDQLRIGEVAYRAGVGVDTVRFYERRGLLPAPPRRPSGYRVFTQDTIERILVIREVQSLGFTLEEIVELLRAVDRGHATCETEQPKMVAVLTRLDEKLASLQRVRRDLDRALRRCRSGRCNLVERVARGPRPHTR